MPITVIRPTGIDIGPGLSFVVSSNFVGPLGTDAVWEIQIFGPGVTEDPILQQRMRDTNKFASGVLGVPVDFPAEGIYVAAQDGATVRMVVSLQSPSVGFFEEETVEGLHWAPSSAISPLLRGLQQGSGTGGFTESDRQLLLEVQGNTRVLYNEPTPVPTEPSLPLGEFAWNGALGLLNTAESVVISGRGSARRGPNPDTTQAYGVRVFLLDWPAGYGRTPGAVDIFERRMVQLVVVRRTNGGAEWASNIWDIHESGAIFRWDPPLPHRLEYLVAPGVTAELQWYVLPFQ